MASHELPNTLIVKLHIFKTQTIERVKFRKNVQKS